MFLHLFLTIEIFVMKIVFSTESVSRNGGIQTVTIVKANALAEIVENDVYIVVPHNNGLSPRKISQKVHLINLGIENYWVSVFKQPARNKTYKKLLRDVLERIGPDVVISTGLQDRNFLPSIKVSSNPVFVREIHFMSNYRRLMAGDNLKEKILARISEFLDYNLSIKKYDLIALLSKEDRIKNWNGMDKVVNMPNPLTVTSNVRSNLNSKKAIAVGRLCYQKHFDALIKAWRLVADKYPEWELDIWGGNGPLYDDLVKLIADLSLQNNVFLKGETTDISSKMAEASMIISTSVFEGMPLVLLEGLAVGLPIVTFNYKYGADEIVKENQNGFIVEQDDLDLLAERIEQLILDRDLRLRMGECSYIASQEFRPEMIAERWMNLFTKLRTEKSHG